jgi:hypothetical protein
MLIFHSVITNKDRPRVQLKGSTFLRLHGFCFRVFLKILYRNRRVGIFSFGRSSRYVAKIVGISRVASYTKFLIETSREFTASLVNSASLQGRDLVS